MQVLFGRFSPLESRVTLDSRVTDFRRRSSLFQGQGPVLKTGVNMLLFLILKHGYVDIRDKPPSLIFTFQSFSLSSRILSFDFRCELGQSSLVASLRPKMTTHCISVSLLQYWSCMQLLLISTLLHSSWVLDVLRLHLGLFSQWHTRCQWSQTLFFSDSVNPLYFPNYLSSQGCHNSFSS